MLDPNDPDIAFKRAIIRVCVEHSMLPCSYEDVWMDRCEDVSEIEASVANWFRNKGFDPEEA